MSGESNFKWLFVVFVIVFAAAGFWYLNSLSTPSDASDTSSEPLPGATSTVQSSARVNAFSSVIRLDGSEYGIRRFGSEDGFSETVEVSALSGEGSRVGLITVIPKSAATSSDDFSTVEDFEILVADPIILRYVETSKTGKTTHSLRFTKPLGDIYTYNILVEDFAELKSDPESLSRFLEFLKSLPTATSQETTEQVSRQISQTINRKSLPISQRVSELAGIVGSTPTDSSDRYEIDLKQPFGLTEILLDSKTPYHLESLPLSSPFLESQLGTPLVLTGRQMVHGDLGDQQLAQIVTMKSGGYGLLLDFSTYPGTLDSETSFGGSISVAYSTRPQEPVELPLAVYFDAISDFESEEFGPYSDPSVSDCSSLQVLLQRDWDLFQERVSRVTEINEQLSGSEKLFAAYSSRFVIDSDAFPADMVAECPLPEGYPGVTFVTGMENSVTLSYDPAISKAVAELSLGERSLG